MKRVGLAVRLGACGVAVMVNSGGAAAQDISHPFMILSEGGSTCGEYIAEPAKQVLRASWVLGYITGANSQAPLAEAYAGSSFQMPATVGGWLEAYCTAHALNYLVTAAEALRRDFLARERR